MSKQKTSDLVAAAAGSELTRRALMRRAAGAGLTSAGAAATIRSSAFAGPGALRPSISSRFQADAKTLVIADNLADQWITLDPAIIYEINSQAGMNVVYECLYHLPDSTKATEFQPLLADGMPQVSDDGLVITIKLRSGVKFHHTGNEMTADDWIFSWNRLKGQKGNPSFLAEYLGTFEAVDPLTLKLTLQSPNVALVPILASTPFSVTDSKTVQAQGGKADETPESEETRKWMTENSAGTGPYVITKFDIQTEVIIERFPDYWGDAAQLDRIIWRNEKDAVTQLQLVQTGEADIAYYLDPDSASVVEGDSNLQMLSGPTLSIDYLALNNSPERGGPLANVQVRQAFSHAIDYDTIINVLAQGAAVKPATVIPLGLLGTEEVQSQGPTYDLARAQELFAASGVATAEVTLTYNAGSSGYAGIPNDTLMSKLKEDLEQIDGVSVKLEPMPGDQRLAAYRAGELQFTFAGWAPDYPDVHTYAEPFGKSGSGAAKRVAYSNPRVDELLAQGLTETDPEKRKQIYIEIQQHFIEDSAFIVLAQPIDRKPARSVVQGVTTHSVYLIQLRYASKTA